MKTDEQKKDLRVARILWYFIGMASTLIFLSLASCSTQITTAYKVKTPKGNFYTNNIEFRNDSVFMIESNKTSLRRIGMFKESEIRITER